MDLKTHATKFIILAAIAIIVVVVFSLPKKITHINNPIGISTSTLPVKVTDSVSTSTIPKKTQTPTKEQENTVSISCPTMQGDESVCITLYKPVCAQVQIQCITTPCNPVSQTFSNSCTACNNPLVSSYTEGKCKNK